VATTDFRPGELPLNSIPASPLFSDIDFLALGRRKCDFLFLTSAFFLSVSTIVGSSFRLLTSYFLRERITKAANAICLKDYSSFLKSKEAPALMAGF
jgi:hypothetical protein